MDFLELAGFHTDISFPDADISDITTQDTLTIQADPELCKRILNNLFSNILKYMYAQTTMETISINNEVEYIRQYVDLQSLRLNKHTQVVFETQIDDEHAKIPPMILITFVENTFKYGVSSDVDCLILIRITVKKGELLFETENTVMKENHANPHAIGIENCRKRLELLYPNRFTLIMKEENRQFKIRLSIQL